MKSSIRELIKSARSRGWKPRRGLEPPPQRSKPSPSDGSPGERRTIRDGRLRCLECREWKPAAQFSSYTKRAGKRYFESRCDPCRKLVAVAYRHGITAQTYRQLLEASGGHCAICRRAFGMSKFDGPILNHSRRTGKPRAFLCARCNYAVCALDRGDDSAVLDRIVEYMQYWETREDGK